MRYATVIDMLLDMTVPDSLTVSTLVTCVLAVLLPVCLWLALRLRRSAGIVPTISGILFFFISVIIIESLFLAILFDNFPNLHYNNSAYVLTVSICAGFIVEVSCFVAIYWLKAKHPGVDNALSFALGFGGAEAVVFTVLGSASTFLMLNRLNNGTLKEYLSTFPQEQAEDIAANLIDTLHGGAFEYYSNAFTCLTSIVFHICATLLLWLAVNNVRRLWWLLPLVMLSYSLVSVPMAIYQTHSSNIGLWMVKLMTAGAVSVFVYITYELYRKLRP